MSNKNRKTLNIKSKEFKAFENLSTSDEDSSFNSWKSSFKKSFKTRICKNFSLKNKCHFGEKCSYAHGKWELREMTE